MSIARGQMEEYPVLQKNYAYLLREIEADILKDLMHQENILDRDDLDRINAEETTKTKNEMLLKILHNRKDSFSVFLRILRSKGYDHVASKLQEEKEEYLSMKPTPSKLPRMKTFDGEEITSINTSRQFWKCEDDIARYQQFSTDQSALCQRISFLKQKLFKSNAELCYQREDVAKEIHSTATFGKANIERAEEMLVMELNQKCRKLGNGNLDTIHALENLERRAKNSRTSDERKDIEMELEEVETSGQCGSLVFTHSETMSEISLGRLDVQSASGKVYKGNIYWNTDRKRKMTQNKDGAPTLGRREEEVSFTTSCHTQSAILKVEFSTKLQDEEMEDCGLVDITVLSSGTVVVTDGLYRCLKSFWYRENELCFSRLSVDEPPWQVTRISNTSVAVTIPSLKQIRLLQVKPELSLEKVLMVDKEYWGLVRMDSGDLAASAMHSYIPCIEVIDLQGNIKRRIYSAKCGPSFLYRLWYLGITHKGDILVCDISKIALLCISKEGGVKSTFSPDWEEYLEDPHGVCCDKDGTVYLAHSTANEICCLSADGLTAVRTLGRGLNLNKPWGLSISNDGWLYVAESDGVVKAYVITG